MSKQRNGFTLIELVVVILILGILAGVGAPKLFSTSSKASESGVKQTLSIIRDSIELYAADNGGSFPPCTGTGADFQAALAKYVRGKFPECSVGPTGIQNNLITPVTTTTATNATTGWMFNTSTGEFICNCTEATPSDALVGYDDL
jgi:prepilin-type N-terminal cleavage/methylation domain-containing protein